MAEKKPLTLEQQLSVQIFNLRELVLSLRRENAQLTRRNAELTEAINRHEQAKFEQDLQAASGWLKEAGLMIEEPQPLLKEVEKKEGNL